jgi:hypothetical protein
MVGVGPINNQDNLTTFDPEMGSSVQKNKDLLEQALIQFQDLSNLSAQKPKNNP